MGQNKFYETVMRLCSQKGISITTLAQSVGKNSSTATGWKNGAVPRPETVKKIADYFGVPVDYLTSGGADLRNSVFGKIHNSNVVQGNHAQTLIVRNGEKAERPLSRQEIELLRVFSALSVKDQTRLLGFAFELETAPSK